jgi:hypothetical protein
MRGLLWRRGADQLRAGRRRLTIGLTCGVTALFAPGLVAAASAADFNPSAGSYTADTSALTLTGPGVSVTGQNVNGVAVFSFQNVDIPVGATVVATGSRPFEFRASGNFTLAGVISAAGKSATNFVAGPNAGGAGGGFGGTDATQPGGGSGGGAVASSGSNGAGGGGFGGAGAPGGCNTGTCPSGQNAGAGGSAYGDLDVLFQGGSGGGGATATSMGSTVGGGGGGGGVAIYAASITTLGGSQITAAGGNGAAGGFGASGGGSGGGIFLHANVINAGGLLSAIGGQGGAGGCCGDGGGGGGGRIAYQYSNLVSAGTADVAGGTSGTASSPSGFSSGGASPVPRGATGVVSKVQGAVANTTPGSDVSRTAATLNGTVNPNGSSTTYHFDFGPTTGYGAQVPGSDVFAGSDSSVHTVSQTVSGLAANTTYHYRIVASDALGLVAVGSDVEFTTPPLPPPPVSSAVVSPLGAGATIKLSCSGVAGLTCAGRFTVTAHRRRCGNTITGVTASTRRRKCIPKTSLITLGSGSYSAAAGQTQTSHFSVNATGKALLTQFYKLPTTFTFQASSGVAPASRTVRFAYQRIIARLDDFNLAVGVSSVLVHSWFVTGVPSRGRVKVVCRSRGCPFRQRVFKRKHRVSILGGARLAVGATVRITVTAPNRVGKVGTFTIKSLATPKKSFSCLPPGARAPKRCVS